MSYGTCKKCGCTDTDACYHLDFGPCWWVDESHELCSHCVEFSNDTAIELPCDFSEKKRQKEPIN